MSTLRYAALLAALTLAAPARAAEAMKMVPAALDPARGYVLVRMGERAPELWNLLSIAAYDDKAEDLRGKGRAKANPVVKGADRAVVIGPKPFIAADAHVRIYLVAVTPGRYVIAGGPTTCYCLGSYQFDVAPGRITDMGTVYIGAENGSSPWAALSQLRSSPDIEERGYTIADAMAVVPWQESMGMPDGIAALPRDAASFAPARRFGNHGGQLLNRALPIGGGK